MMMINGPFTKIKGLSDIRRLPGIGKIRLGEKVISEGESAWDGSREIVLRAVEEAGLAK